MAASVLNLFSTYSQRFGPNPQDTARGCSRRYGKPVVSADDIGALEGWIDRWIIAGGDEDFEKHKEHEELEGDGDGVLETMSAA